MSAVKATYIGHDAWGLNFGIGDSWLAFPSEQLEDLISVLLVTD